MTELEYTLNFIKRVTRKSIQIAINELLNGFIWRGVANKSHNKVDRQLGSSNSSLLGFDFGS